ncbi:MAG TPA: ABC transporter permease [Terracidiphilus sp.]|nr:ABC transporter permease [Terracidiphilus sp.]
MAHFRRIVNLFHRSRIDREIDAELRTHIEMRIDENVAAGMSREEARRDALVRFGSPTSTKERVTAADAALSLDTLVRDVRYASRQLLRSPGFAITAVITLAVAIGANAIVFSVLNALVLRPLNLPDAHRLFTIQQGGVPFNSYPDYRDLRERNRAFDGVAAYNIENAGLHAGDEAERVWIYEASGNYFDVLGVKPCLGRFFHAGDDRGPDSNPYVVLSFAYWQNRFQGDAGVVGREIELNRHTFTILGVAPPGMRGTELFYSPDLWVPLVDQKQIEGTSALEDRTSRGLWLVGRVKAGTTVAQATSDLNAVAGYMRKTYPKQDEGLTFSLAKPGLVGDFLGGPVRAFVAGLMLLSGLILLAACANLGSLFAARAVDRAREIALRLALGSTRRRILRQLAAEAVLVSLVGGAAGIAASVVLLRALSIWQPVAHMPINVPVTPDLSTYAVAVALALVSGFLCGLTPVRQVLGTAPWELVKSGLKTTSGKKRFALRDVLLVIQIAACAVLMTSSLVAVRGLARSLNSNFGFDPRNAVLVDSDMNMAGYTGDRMAAMQRRILDAGAALPGVDSAGLISNIPLGLGWSMASIYRDNTTVLQPSNELAEPVLFSVSPGYFKAAGTTLLAGRSFSWNDNKDAPKAIVINRELARKAFGSVAGAVGGHLRFGDKTRVEVVGVVEDGKYLTLTEDPRCAFFQPLLQAPSSETWLVVRSARNSQSLAATLRETVRNLDAGLPFAVISWTQELDSALFAARAATVSLGVLGALGAMLAITGIFGMASYSVGKRLREMGIRIALGAGHGQVLRAALGGAFRLLGVGSAIGLALGLAATRVLGSIVYQASPRDPVVLAGSVFAMLVVGLIAAWRPAQRAVSVDPSKLMREE